MHPIIQGALYALFFTVGMYLGWMFSAYLDKIAEWRKKRMKKA